MMALAFQYEQVFFPQMLGVEAPSGGGILYIQKSFSENTLFAVQIYNT